MRELRTLLPYLKPYRWPYLIGLALVVVSNFFATLGPRFLQHGIDALRAGGEFRQVQTAVALLMAVAVAGGLARYGMRELLNSGSRRVETDLRDQLYVHLQRMSAEFYDRYPTGDVMARTTNDLLAVRMVAGPALMYLVDTTIRALLVAPAMITISPRLTLLAFFPLLTLLGGASGLVVLYAGGRLVMASSVSVGEFIAFGVYLAMLVWPMIALGCAV